MVTTTSDDGYSLVLYQFNWYAYKLFKHDFQERRLLKELIQSGAPELIMRLSEQIKYLGLALQECQV